MMPAPNIERDLEIARKILSLPEMDDKEQLRLAVLARVEEMNAVDKLSFKATLGQIAREAAEGGSGERHDPPTWTLAITAIFYEIFAVVSTYVVFRTRWWLLLKVPVGLMGIFWFLFGMKALQQLMFRLFNGSD